VHHVKFGFFDCRSWNFLFSSFRPDINTIAADCSKDLRGKARDQLASAGVLSLYVEARQWKRNEAYEAFQQSA
jgi:hypothetical protein